MVRGMTSNASQALTALVEQVKTIIVGKEAQIVHSVACLLSGGHLLIEDLPGVGKTTLAQALALSLGLNFHRVQFTADLLPADVLGASVYDPTERQFRFQPGPVFAQVLLADEINRAGPRTQSALLEAMEERQVTVDQTTRALPAPFFVIATQNPQDQAGTYPLPESQLDRFVMCLSLGYPDAVSERSLWTGQDRRAALAALRPVMDLSQLQALQAQVGQVHAAPALLDYLQALVQATRSGQWFVQGLSPRAALSLLRVTRARALLAGRDYATPEDLQDVLPPCLGHRLVPVATAGRGAREQTRALIEATPLP